MDPFENSADMLIDFISGRKVPHIGAEGRRQKVERLLVEGKGYAREDIEVDAPIILKMETETYSSHVDLVVSVCGCRYMAIKCAPGSLGSREREIVAAARLLDAYQIPLAAASDGQDALIWDTVTGRLIGKGLAALPSRARALKDFDPNALTALAPDRIRRQQLIFRSYDSMNINAA
jgi:hypothetical protein